MDGVSTLVLMPLKAAQFSRSAEHLNLQLTSTGLRYEKKNANMLTDFKLKFNLILSNLI